SRARARSGGGRGPPPPTPGRRRAPPQAGARPIVDSRAAERPSRSPRRAPGEGNSVVPRNEQRACFRNARPRRNLHDGVHRARARARAHLAQAFAETRAELRAGGSYELELLTGRRRELDELEPELDDGRRQLRELRPE